MTTAKDFIESVVESLDYARAMLTGEPSQNDIARARAGIDAAKKELDQAVKQLNEAKARI